ncbi:hypothetical protein SAMN06265222_105284 [Neorhodopirellula lusitana]|uniref:HTTM domain-containing protein n=1 Tax=Neorhodopirellula lusitana TaxID=445327 RepID=A0ABY1Q3I5_9BACT|nr:hypothetical protein [Neorhodopirellula lusitana]SMP57222.1 hypothetical protein SAMN06265222_105284 [Neorhodopirellula lusitana]
MSGKRKAKNSTEQTRPATSGGLGRFDAMVAWWLSPMERSAIAPVRGLLGLMAALYFIDALTDVSFWFGVDGVHSSRNVAEFLQISGLGDAASVSISPLFLTDAIWVYQVYCFVTIVLSVMLMAGRGGRSVGVAVWLAVVFWANRLMWLAGLTETLLSLTLFATCFAPAWKWSLTKASASNQKTLESVSAESLSAELTATSSVATGLAIRLAAVQTSLIVVATWLSMLAGTVWWNGTGSIALAAPESVRTLALVDRMQNPLVYETITLWIFVAAPVGLWLSWGRGHVGKARRIGVALLMAWAMTLAVLGSHWIYGGVLVSGFLAIAMGVRGKAGPQGHRATGLQGHRVSGAHGFRATVT